MANEYLTIAKELMEKEQKPMTPKQMVDLAYERRMFSDKVSGKTPHQTLKAELYRHVRKMGDGSEFVRTEAGKFYLRRLLPADQKISDWAPLQPPAPKENVLVFPSSWLDEHDRFQGITLTWKRLTRMLLTPDICRYMDRISAEQNDDYKQVLTYILVTRKDRVLAFKRGKFNRVQDFLRGSQCIGFGGHVSVSDLNLFDQENMGIFHSAARELREELRLPPKDIQRLDLLDGLEVIGLLNDDSSPEGRRHFAVVMKFEVSDDPYWEKPIRGEKSITQLRWLDPSASDFSLWDFEYWSQLCLRCYFPRLAQTKSSFMIRRKKPLKPPHLLCVLGELGSGKTETTRVLKEEFGYVEINSGRVVAEILGIPPVPETPRSDFQDLAWQFISSKDGPRRLAEAIWKKIEELREQFQVDKFPRFLIDGIRQNATLQELKALAHDRRIGILYVYTPPDVAYEFYMKRQESACTIHDFLKLRENPVESEVREMIGKSDAVLYNWSGHSLFTTKIRQLMGEINR